MRRLIAALALLTAALGSTAHGRSSTTLTGTRLTNATAHVACDANIHLVDSPACTSFEIFVTSGDSLRVSVTWDVDGTAGDLTVWADTSPDSAVPWSLEGQPVINASGQIDMQPQSMVIDASSDGSVSWQYTAFVSVWIRFRFVWASADASDLLTSVTTQHR